MCAPGRSVSSLGFLRRSPAAAAEFITGPLLDNPRRVDVRCVMNTPGSIPPAVDLTGVCVTG